MEFKRCSNPECCEKPISEFGADKSRKDGLQLRCKECNAADYRKKHPKDTMFEDDAHKECSECRNIKPKNEFAFRNDTNKYRSECKTCQRKKKSKYYEENKDDINKRRRENKTPEQRSAAVKRTAEWRIKNPEKHKKNREKESEKRHIKRIERRKEKGVNEKKNANIQTKIAENLRSALRQAIKKNAKRGRTIENLGCSIKELKQRFENIFYCHPEADKIMTWKNYGKRGWHIDHIIPLSAFDLTDEKQVKIACHYTNLQPLWAEENLRKHAKILRQGE